MAIWLKANGDEVEVSPANPPHFTLEELHKYCSTDIVQMVFLRGRREMMWMDEEAKLRERIPQFNKKATALLHKAGGMLDDWVAGDVLITHETEVE